MCRLNLMGFFLGTQERVRNSRGNRAISVEPLKIYCMLKPPIKNIKRLLKSEKARIKGWDVFYFSFSLITHQARTRHTTPEEARR